MESSHSQCLKDSPANEAVPVSLFRLPLELRRMIYWWSIEFSRSPTPDLVHMTNLSVTWKDRPSPLLSTSRQVRNEVKCLLRCHKLFTLRLTSFGAAFDMLSLSCAIAQDLPLKDYKSLPGLQIEIWPPHMERTRTLETLYLYQHIRKLRFELQTGTQIAQISICFLENDLVKWAEDSRPRDCLGSNVSSHRNDFETLLDQFAFVTNVVKASVHLPPSLQSHRLSTQRASFVVQTMETGFLSTPLKSEGEHIKENYFTRRGPGSLENYLTICLPEKPINYFLMYKAWYGQSESHLAQYTHIDHFKVLEECPEAGPSRASLLP